jgi:DNA damage-binding protein 1
VSLDASTLFIGSHFADSLTVSLQPTLHPKQPIITNLAPISDFLVLPPFHPQAGAVITCSGGLGQGTLRVVRQGVGIEDYAAVDFEGIRGVWTLANYDAMEIDGPTRDGVLVLSLIERTVFLEMDTEGGLEAIEGFAKLIDSEETIALKQIGEKIIQVTTEQIHISTQGVKTAGYPGKISAAQITDNQILISSGRNMRLLSFDCKIIQEWTLQEEITCLDIHGNLIAIGLWNSTVQLISLPTNTSTYLESPLSAPARSIIITTIFPTQTLLIGSRDGTLTTYTLPLTSPPTDKKTVSLGTQPLRLFPLSTPSRSFVFASSDRPTLIHVTPNHDGAQKLVLSALSIRDVLSLTPLQHPAYPNSLVIATKEGFRIGKMDQISRLQVRSVDMPNGELPRRIARIDAPPPRGASGVVGVVSLRIVFDVDGSERTEGYLRAWDEDSWQCTSSPSV